MPTAGERPEPTPAERARATRERLDRVFGDVLPDTTGDERDELGEGAGSDDWLRRQVPPHHG